jgi:hypothetical protein
MTEENTQLTGAISEKDATISKLRGLISTIDGMRNRLRELGVEGTESETTAYVYGMSKSTGKSYVPAADPEINAIDMIETLKVFMQVFDDLRSRLHDVKTVLTGELHLCDDERIGVLMKALGENPTQLSALCTAAHEQAVELDKVRVRVRALEANLDSLRQVLTTDSTTVCTLLDRVHSALGVDPTELRKMCSFIDLLHDKLDEKENEIQQLKADKTTIKVQPNSVSVIVNMLRNSGLEALTTGTFAETINGNYVADNADYILHLAHTYAILRRWALRLLGSIDISGPAYNELHALHSQITINFDFYSVKQNPPAPKKWKPWKFVDDAVEEMITGLNLPRKGRPLRYSGAGSGPTGYTPSWSDYSL